MGTIETSQHSFTEQRGFWDEEQTIHKLRHKKPMFFTLTESIPWECFQPWLEQDYAKERKYVLVGNG